jgi:hypothetical protein
VPIKKEKLNTKCLEIMTDKMSEHIIQFRHFKTIECAHIATVTNYGSFRVRYTLDAIMKAESSN